MVRIVITVVMYLISIIGYAQMDTSDNSETLNKKELKVKVEINRVLSNKGSVYFAIYDSQNNFANRKPLKVSTGKVENGKVEIAFDHLKPGEYAITCYHDANNNGKMDFETNGMPLEDYGATNNVMNYGPPRFNDAKFELQDKDLTFEIKF